jgi:hypothetical protein
MPSIRQKGHGPESPSGKDLHNHGHAGQPENGPRTLLSTPMIMVIMGTRMGHACLLYCLIVKKNENQTIKKISLIVKLKKSHSDAET